MEKELTLWDGWKIVREGHDDIVCDCPSDVWKLFGWDIENDKEARECSKLITREVFCFGDCDLSEMAGYPLRVIAIPAKGGELD